MCDADLKTAAVRDRFYAYMKSALDTPPSIRIPY